MKKSFRYLIIAFIITLVIIGHNYLSPMLGIITGYAAKNMCSCVFVAERNPESAIAGDLNFSFIKYAKTWIDREEKAAYSTILGLSKRKAIFREGLGCVLVLGDREEELMTQCIQLPGSPQGLDTIAWPVGDWIKDTILNDVIYEKLYSALEIAFDQHTEIREKNTRSVVVVYKNHLIVEKYAEEFDLNTPQLGWSMTKSITNAMIGLLVKKGELDVNRSPGFNEWENDDRKGIRINDLMHMNSGLEWNEEYGNKSDATVMLYLQDNMSEYAINKPLSTEPGSNWLYSSGTSNILQAVIRSCFQDQENYWLFPHEELFSKIGMYHTVIEPDCSGTYVGSSYTWATPRDWARFGLLYLNDGVWEEERILPEGWITYTRDEARGSDGGYGAQFWINDSGSLPDAPTDMFWAQGFQGQRVYIIPSRSLVIVRLGISEKGTFDFNQFLESILSAFPEG